MSVKEIEAAITRLSAEEIAELAAWLTEYQSKTWDEQIAEDYKAGRLDGLLAEVDREIEAGLARPL